MALPKRAKKRFPVRILRAYTAVRNYRKRIREDDTPYVPPQETWGAFSDEFSDEFYKGSEA